MPHADVAGLRLYYERAGSGEPELLFLPGWCCDHTAFQPQFDHFGRTHSVTSLDLRGIGRSDAPHDGYSIPGLADDVAAFCDVVGIEKPVVVGHSLGGMIAVDLGARYPSLPGALVLVDPGPIDPLPETVAFFRGFAEQLEGPEGAASASGAAAICSLAARPRSCCFARTSAPTPTSSGCWGSSRTWRWESPSERVISTSSKCRSR
jgi:pimeloyl-ACP methyl ester carboxylesterase